MLDPTTLSSLKVTELKAELKKRGLPVGGLKQTLVDRLAEDILQEQQRAQDEAEAVAPEEQVPIVEDVEQANGSMAETVGETPDVAPEVATEQLVQEEVRAKTPEPEPAQVQEPVKEQELVQEQLQQPEPVQERQEESEPVQERQQEPEPVQERQPEPEPVQERQQESEPTPVQEQLQEEPAAKLPQQEQEQEQEGHAVTEAAEEKPQVASEQLVSEQQELPEEKPEEKPEEREEPVSQAEEPEVPVEADGMQIDTEPEKAPEDAPASIPREPATKEEDAPMAEAPVEAPAEAPSETPVEAPIEATIIPASSSLPTSTEDQTTTAPTPQPNLDAPTAPSEPMDTCEDTPPDLRKRKRRSASPPPAEEALPTPTGVPASEEGSVSKKPRASSPAPKPRQRDARFKGLFNNGDTPTHDDANADTSADPTAAAVEDDDDPPVPPSIHPATRALYIRNLIRPINEPLLRSHLSTLAGATTGEAIEFFFVDAIKSHALMIFASVTAATRVRVGVHGKVWPNERTRKPLWADFVPEEAVEGWVQREKKSRARWEIVYTKGEGEDGGVRAELEEVGAGGSQARGRGTVGGGRGVELLGAPTGPRGVRERVGERKNSVLAVQKSAPTQSPADATSAVTGPRTTRVVDLDDLFKSTLAKPKLYYMPVSEEIARERLAARGRDERGRH